MGNNTWVIFHKESLCPRDEFRLFTFTVIANIVSHIGSYGMYALYDGVKQPDKKEKSRVKKGKNVNGSRAW